MKNLGGLVNFFIEIESLKKTYRFSTCPEEIRDSSADHSWKLAFMAFVLDSDIKDIDIYHSIQICLVHDLAEFVVGDIDSYRIALEEITKEQKYLMEEKAMGDIKNKVPGVGPRLYDLWKEFEEGKTQEARYAKALDRMEAMIHILNLNYVAREDNLEAEHTAKYADKAVEEFPQLEPLLKIIKLKLKKEYETKGFKWKDSYNKFILNFLFFLLHYTAYLLLYY